MGELHRLNPPIILYSHYHNVLWEVRRMLKEKNQKPTKKLSLKTLTNKELKQINQKDWLEYKKITQNVEQGGNRELLINWYDQNYRLF